jgi:hypothetical protein
MRIKTLVAGLFISATFTYAQTTVVDRPELRTSSNYTNFRAPLKAAPLLKLPVGKIQPKGWLLRCLGLR